jgi:MFS family permease
MNLSRQALTVVISSNVGQLPVAMRGLTLVLLGREVTGTYVGAGVGAAAAAVGLGATSPMMGKWLRCYGHRITLLVTVGAAGIAQLALAVNTNPTAFIVLAAAVGATSPPTASSGRAVIPHLVSPELIRRAYAVNAIARELVYVGGPLWITAWLVLGGPRAALVSSAAVGTVGVVICAATSRDVCATRHEVTVTVLRHAGVRTLTMVAFAYMVCMGMMWVLVPAFAAATGDPSAAGVLVTVWSGGSVVGGTLFAVRRGRSELDATYLWLLAVLTCTSMLLTLPRTADQMAVGIAVFGLALSPWLATADELVTHLAPDGRAEETYGWMIAAGQSGTALGSGIAGALAEWKATGVPFLGVAVALCAALTIGRLRQPSLIVSVQSPSLASSCSRRRP